MLTLSSLRYSQHGRRESQAVSGVQLLKRGHTTKCDATGIILLKKTSYNACKWVKRLGSLNIDACARNCFAGHVLWMKYVKPLRSCQCQQVTIIMRSVFMRPQAIHLA